MAAMSHHAPLSVPPANRERRWGDDAGCPPWYKDLKHHLGPPEQLEHSQPRLGWRDCEEGKQNYTASLCVVLFFGGAFKARRSHLGFFWKTLSG